MDKWEVLRSSIQHYLIEGAHGGGGFRGLLVRNGRGLLGHMHDAAVVNAVTRLLQVDGVVVADGHNHVRVDQEQLQGWVAARLLVLSRTA